MSFQAQLSMDAERVELRDYGESVTYKAGGGEGVATTGIIARDEVPVVDERDGETKHLWATVRLLASVATAPAEDDVISFKRLAGIGDAVDFDVVGPPQAHGDGWIRFRCHRLEKVEVSGRGWRRPLSG